VSGEVLEVAVGTGKNLCYYPQDCRITAVDVSAEMLSLARKRAAKLSMGISFLLSVKKRESPIIRNKIVPDFEAPRAGCKLLSICGEIIVNELVR
jgi:hypothetical protein